MKNRFAIVFFDGHCLICLTAVRLILKFEKDHFIKFAPLQGQKAKLYLSTDQINNCDSVIYFDGVKSFEKSSAILKILNHMPIWLKVFQNLSYLFSVKSLDKAYDFIARNRFKLFKRKETCYLPRPEEKDRFLD